MVSTPASDLAYEILESCLRDGTWPVRVLETLVDRALDQQDESLARDATRALFAGIIEPLGDLFEPALCDTYAQLFSHVIARAIPEYEASELVRRYRIVRQAKPFAGGDVQHVFILSRITLGADIAITSVVLDAAKRSFPEAQIYFVGPEKNAELFAADPRIAPVALPYNRTGLLLDRLAAATDLRVIVSEPGSIVIDPDSRLTQLGLMPVCEDARYYFFESRAYGGTLDGSLPDLTSAWVAETFDIEGPPASNYVAPVQRERVADISVSFGVGDNEKKRIDDEFEYEVLSAILQHGRSVVLDRGAEGEESDRIDALAQRVGSTPLLHLHHGSYASFASQIVQSALYVGYDSVGQHVAAAARVPLVSVFNGYISERMLARWTPRGTDSHVIAAVGRSRSAVFEETRSAIDAVLAEAEERAN